MVQKAAWLDHQNGNFFDFYNEANWVRIEFVRKITTIFSKIPGVGLRNAKKALFDLASWSKNDLQALIACLIHLKENGAPCRRCGFTVLENDCTICSKSNSHSLDCIAFVANSIDVMLIEDSYAFSGTYHVLGGLLSPDKGIFGCNLFLHTLNDRFQEVNPKEILLAFEATLEGDATAFFVKKQIEELCCCLEMPFPIFSRIAFGLPMGGRLSSSDPFTIAKAIQERKCF